MKRLLQANVHGFVVWKLNSIQSENWRKTTKYQTYTFCNLLSCRAPTFPFWGIFHCINHFQIVRRWRFQKCPWSVLKSYLSDTEYSYSKITGKLQGPTPGVRLIESIVTVKWLKNGRDQHQVSVLKRCPLRESWLYGHFWNRISFIHGRGLLI